MLTRRKEIREAKETRRQLEDYLLVKLAGLVEAQQKNEETAAAMAAQAQQMKESFSETETREYLTLLQDFMKQMKEPEFGEAFYEKLADQAAWEKRTDLEARLTALESRLVSRGGEECRINEGD